MTAHIGPDYQFHISTAREPSISPDGTRVAYSVHRFDADTGDSLTDIFVAPLDGSSAPVQLTDNGKAKRPSWNSDRTLIGFIAPDGDGTDQVWTVSETQPAKQLTSSQGSVDALAWSPDGSSIAFRAWRIAAMPGTPVSSVARCGPAPVEPSMPSI